MIPSIDIIYNHSDFLIVNKQQGVQMHHLDGDYAILPMMELLGFSSLNLVHRLDAETSGLMILAKNKQAASKFGSLFEDGLIQKHYIALSDFKPKKKQGHVLGDMRKSRRGDYALSRTTHNPAYTQFMSRSIKFDEKSTKRLFILRPHTGKTHQLRVALKSLGSPILGDARYANTNADRMYLHAFHLSFTWETLEHHFCAQPNSGKWFNDSEFLRHFTTFKNANKLAWPTAKTLPKRRTIA
jgi:tRNA pseudouridine32 synthase/23S rRNA pseudouridine746 synthase